ncbi:MAG: endonuclease MutS2 [Candidatus Sericytochromatia bacterium]|nr:endonuclease MutS2 [Candidatus Tanganyikabacteria bacterium]
MDPESLQRLEWPAVVGHLVACALTRHGADRCRDVEILTDPRDVAEALALTQEARYLATMTQGIPLGGCHDLREALRRAEQGGVLDPQALLAIADTLGVAKRVRDFLDSHAEAFPRLAELAFPLSPLPELARELHRCLDSTGQVRDDASADLARIRQQIARLQAGIRAEVQRMLSRLAEYLQESLVTVRGDRYVLPVRAEFKTKVPGLVHDQSASGQTLFIEPMALVNLNNDILKARLDERDEVARILEELTDLVAGNLWELRATDEGLAEVDFASARGRLADRWDGHAPRVESAGPIRFYKARHPLLVEARLADPQRAVVPVDLVLESPALVVTGPNTGGKTVTLKTLGLCALLAQAGIHPPVGQGSATVVFGDVFADIGDEQDLAASLSTFSGHMRNLVALLARANARSLVLLDEVGAGTDPAEGAAIARTVIEALIARGARLVATTHLADLKLLPYQVPGTRNASVEFDPATTMPTYRLLIGVPGHSNAIAIARRLGFPGDLADRAREYLEAGADEATRLVNDLSRERQEAATLRQEAERTVEAARALEEEYRGKVAKWNEERKRLRAAADAEFRQAVAAAQFEVRQIIAELKGQRSGQMAGRASDRLNKLHNLLRTEESAPREPMAVRPGDTVFVPRLNQTAVVQTAPDESGELTLQVGVMKVTAKATELEPPPEGSGAAKRHEKRALRALSASPTPAAAAPEREIALVRHSSREIDLRGMQVHEALPAVERFLDDAFHHGVDAVCLIHGAGTGALRRAIREHLPGLAYARSFRPGGHGEGGDGVTVVHLT